MRKFLLKYATLFAGALMCVSLVLPLSASAATWLGDQQGVPSTYNWTEPYPSYTQCAVNVSCQSYGYNGSEPYPLCVDVDAPVVCAGGAQPSYPNYLVFWSGVFSAHPPNSTAGQTKYIWSYWNGTLNNSIYSAGSAPSVAVGGQLTLEWSCQPSRQVYKMQHTEGYFQNIGTFVNLNPLTTSVTGTGAGFTSGMHGSQTITAPSTTGTYNYTLTCNSSYNLPTMTIPVTVTGPPPPPPTCANGLDYATYGPSCTCPTGQVQSGTQCVVEASITSFTTSNATPNSGDPVVLSWQSNFANSSCRLGGGSFGTITNNNGALSGGTAVPATGSLSSGPVSAQTTYSLECSQMYGAVNDFAQKQVTVTPTNASGQLIPNPTTVQLNGMGTGSSYIQWYVENADQCQISGDNIPTQQYLGSACSGWHYPLASYNAPGTYNYELQWYTPGTGWQSASAAVTVKTLTPPSLSCLPSTVSPAGADTVCTWSASAADYTSCVGSGPNFTTGGAISGSKQVSVPNTTTYGVTCTGASGSGRASQPVTVQSPHVTSLLSANPTRVQKGGLSVLSWQAVGMSSCAVTDPNGVVVATNSGDSVTVVQATTFTLSCKDAAGNTYPGGSATVGIIPIYTEQ